MGKTAVSASAKPNNNVPNPNAKQVTSLLHDQELFVLPVGKVHNVSPAIGVAGRDDKNTPAIVMKASNHNHSKKGMGR